MTKKHKFLIVASNFYPKITDGLLNGAVTELKRLKCNYDVFRVNGSLEIPVQISRLLKRKRYDAVIAVCLLYTSPSPRDATLSRMPSSA